jgi:hypothetical protein
LSGGGVHQRNQELDVGTDMPHVHDELGANTKVLCAFDDHGAGNGFEAIPDNATRASHGPYTSSDGGACHRSVERVEGTDTGMSQEQTPKRPCASDDHGAGNGSKKTPGCTERAPPRPYVLSGGCRWDTNTEHLRTRGQYRRSGYGREQANALDTPSTGVDVTQQSMSTGNTWNAGHRAQLTTTGNRLSTPVHQRFQLCLSAPCIPTYPRTGPCADPCTATPMHRGPLN